MSHSYIAKESCGCICFAVIDNPDHKKETAKEIGKLIRAGYAIERVTSEFVRNAPWAVGEDHKQHLL